MAQKLVGRIAVSITVLASITSIAGQDGPTASSPGGASALVLGRPFTAIKFARRVRVLADGKQKFISNEHYPGRIARDSEGRLMMQDYLRDDLSSECDQLDMLVPPDCPARTVFVIDPIPLSVTHWVEGERGFHGAVDFPLTPARLEEAAESTSSLPQVGPPFSDEDGKVSRCDLGEKDIEGISTHGVRWTLHYEANEDCRTRPTHPNS